MEYEVTDIVRDVRTVMDRNSNTPFLPDDTDADGEATEYAGTLKLDELIERNLTAAARVALLNAPLQNIGEGVEMAMPKGGIQWESQPGYGMGAIQLPDDYLRLVTFQMTDWSRPVCEAITIDSPQYAMQRSRFPGVKGCPERPVVAVVTYPVGLCLEFYSCRGGAKVAVKRARYLPTPEINNEKITLPERCYDGIVYLTASVVSGLRGDNDAASALGNLSKELLK